jgi:anti-sigma-K factor RskA
LALTVSDSAREPGDIETLLPWYAVGTLRRRDRQRVEEALREDAEKSRYIDLVREELAESIHLNETLGAPPPQALDRLMSAIDAETVAARRHAPGTAATWLTGFFANLSPRTMAVAASFGVLAIALQSFLIVDVFTKPQASGPAAVASAEHHHGTFAMVRFARQASAAEITNFLENYQAALVDGPTPGGLYRVRIAMTSLAKEEMSRVISRMRQDRIVESAEPAEPADPSP